MRKLFFIIAVFSISFTTCKKARLHTIAKVYVIDRTTLKPIPNAEVYLFGENLVNWGGTSYLTHIDKKTTDIQGLCTFDFMADEDFDGYNLGAIAKGYYGENGFNGYWIGESIETGKKKNSTTITMMPEGYLKIFIKNNNPFDESDEIYIDNIVYPGICSGYFYGTNIDTFALYKTWGNHNTKLNWEIKKSNTKTSYTADIYVKSHDTTIYAINY